MENILLKDFIVDNELICEWNYLIVPETDCRIYYKPYKEDDKLGFAFYILENVGEYIQDGIAHGDWDKNRTFFSVLYYGRGYHDGIRHFYKGHEKTNNYGYEYFPSLKVNYECLKELEKLENKYCYKTI